MKSTWRLIVFEAAPYWQPELQRRFLPEGVEVGGCRSIRDLDVRTRTEPIDAVVLDLAADVGGSLRWLAALDERGSRVPVIVIAAAEHTPLEWHVRELGAAAVVDEFIGGGAMAAACRKLFRNQFDFATVHRLDQRSDAEPSPGK